ncbi:MAG: transglutaminase family protein [Candidatus Hydrogenedentota bacterium]
MPDKNQLPYLLQLLDDDSPAVREHVLEQIVSFGPGIEAELEQLEHVLTDRQWSMLRTALAAERETAARREAWRSWPSLHDENEKLETAFELLAQFQYNWTPPIRLSDLLDELASSFLISGRPLDPLGLSRFLFITKKFKGDIEDYHNPLNSNLVHVIQERKGIPITLTCVFILVGSRVGLDIQGCNIPGHFLARAVVNREEVLFDCFNRGRIFSKSDKVQLRASLPPQMLHVLGERASAETIISRVLRNMIEAYDEREESKNSVMARDLLRELQQAAQV